MTEEFHNARPGAPVVVDGGAREYPVPERKGFPWWLLVPLALIPLLLILVSMRGDDRIEEVATTASPTPIPIAIVSSPGGDSGMGTAASASLPQTIDMKVYKGRDITVAPKEGASAKGEPLTDVVVFAMAKDRNALVGRKATLTHVNVTRIVTDRLFYVSTPGGEMPVVLDRRLDAGASGQKVSVADGESVSLTGIIEKIPDAEVMEQKYDLAPEDYSALAEDGVYLHATIAQNDFD